MSGHGLFTSTPHVFLLNIFINKTERSIHFYWIHFLNKIVTWLTHEYVYLWYRLLEINVGTRDTAADEMLYKKMALKIVVYQSSETSTNQSDVIIRSNDRFLNLVVDSDSIVSKIYMYMLNFVLWLFFFCFFVSILTKILQFYPSWFILPS